LYVLIMQQKLFALLLLILAMASFVSTYQFRANEDFLNDKIMELNGDSCVLSNGYCLHTDRNETPYFLGYFTSFGLVIAAFLVVYISFSKRSRAHHVVQKPVPAIAERELDEEEQAVFNLVQDSQGSVFQSDLVRKTEFSKVKITRILDRLETKGLIERRRRGMTNLIVRL